MNNQFDELAKGMAQSATRRAALRKFGVGLAVMQLVALTSLANLIIDTRPNAITTISPFGAGNATFGQTITAPLTDNVLQSFTLQMRQNLPNNTIQCAAYVFAWDAINSRATGPILFSSAQINLTATMQDYTFNTGGVTLTPGGAYVLFASTSLFPGQTADGMWSFAANDAYAGGGFVYLANGTDSSKWTSVAWNTSHMFGDAGFQAEFASVPDSGGGTLLLLLLGFGGLRLIARNICLVD